MPAKKKAAKRRYKTGSKEDRAVRTGKVLKADSKAKKKSPAKIGTKAGSSEWLDAKRKAVLSERPGAYQTKPGGKIKNSRKKK